MSKIVLGREKAHDVSAGFLEDLDRRQKHQGKVFDESDAGLVTIAGTGAGKGVSQIIPNVLTYPGSLVVLDVKGEIAAVTARRRREMGQNVYIVNPFGRADTDAINPLDLVTRQHPSAVDDTRMLAALIQGYEKSHADPFWDERALDMISGALLFIAEHVPNRLRQVSRVREIWCAEEARLVEFLATMAASNLHEGAIAQTARQFVSAPEKTRASILSSTQAKLELFCSPIAKRGLGVNTTGRVVDLEEILSGQPTTIYLTIPPQYLRSHAGYLKLWLGTLITTVLRRDRRPTIPDLFIVDEAAQLGEMPLLLMAATLLRGYGLRMWTFWQSLGQMQRIYGAGHQEFLDNAGTLNVFGVTNGASAEAASSVSGYHGDLHELKADEQIVAQAGKAPKIIQKVTYLEDPELDGLFDDNLYYEDRGLSIEKAA